MRRLTDRKWVAQNDAMNNFRLLALLSATSCLMVVAPALAQTAPDGTDVYGLWLTEAGTGTVRITDCGPGPMDGTPCGIVASADIPDGEPTTDVNNEDPAMRDQPIIGLTMLDGFERSKDKWKKGRIYNPEDGKSYKSVIEREDADTLKVKGCIAFLCQTQRWTRVEEEPESEGLVLKK